MKGRIVLIIIISIFTVSGCSEDPISEDSLLYRGPGPKPLSPLKAAGDSICVGFGNSDFIQLSVFEAVSQKRQGREFSLLFRKFRKLHSGKSLDQIFPYHIEFTLLVPTDLAFRKFYYSNPRLELEGDTLNQFMRHLILAESFPLINATQGEMNSTTMNYESITVKVDEKGCIYFGREEARVLFADEQCSDGYMHSINKVIVPWDE